METCISPNLFVLKYLDSETTEKRLEFSIGPTKDKKETGS